ncbi:MAG TPA: hypothetical protein VGQ26_24840 [Streptosporangiaceae bacterium]|nr:hypothetical protein [Streptosporangiaceae bacterium]
MTTPGVQAAEDFFAALHSQSTITGSLNSSHNFWLGLLIGLAVVPLRGWVRLLMAIVAVFMLGWVHAVGHHVSFSPGGLRWVFVASVGLAVGLWWGRVRGLRQLGESDFRTRSANVRGIARWF